MMELSDVLKTVAKENIAENNSIFKTVGALINNNHTDIVFAEFADKLFLIVTQYKRIGSLISVQKWLTNKTATDSHYTYEINTLFGSNDKEYLAARFVTEIFKTEKPIIFLSALKDHSKEGLQAIRTLLDNIINN